MQMKINRKRREIEIEREGKRGEESDLENWEKVKIEALRSTQSRVL